MDQVKCHHITMQTLASTGNFKNAFDKFFEVMKQLGEELSPNVDPSIIFPAMYATKNDLNKYSTEDLMNVPKMTDKKKAVGDDIHGLNHTLRVRDFPFVSADNRKSYDVSFPPLWFDQRVCFRALFILLLPWLYATRYRRRLSLD
mmetsp:Transcript_5184/g.10811  ORF Transcript_5184/g.10811 Transcript_5184/m.10811 type:complete len:145 (+) Transcript_5184:2-436(+)